MPRMTVQVRSWIEVNGKPLLGPGRARLLKEIDSRGSISAAARALGVTYRTAWRWVESMNRAARRALVKSKRGGREGGGAQLTSYGRTVIKAANRLVELSEKFRKDAGQKVLPALNRR